VQTDRQTDRHTESQMPMMTVPTAKL